MRRKGFGLVGPKVRLAQQIRVHRGVGAVRIVHVH
jgi:hypothetical protein